MDIEIGGLDAIVTKYRLYGFGIHTVARHQRTAGVAQTVELQVMKSVLFFEFTAYPLRRIETYHITDLVGKDIILLLPIEPRAHTFFFLCRFPLFKST